MADLLLQGCSKLIDNRKGNLESASMFRSGLGKSVSVKQSSMAKALSILGDDGDAFANIGLNVEFDRILEIACIVTDGSLTKSIEGPDLVINQSKECMDAMGEWCQTHHAASGY